MSSITSKFFFWVYVIALAFLPGGIFVSTLLLVLYCLHTKNQKRLDYEGIENSVFINPYNSMSTYSQETMEEMR